MSKVDYRNKVLPIALYRVYKMCLLDVNKLSISILLNVRMFSRTYRTQQII